MITRENTAIYLAIFKAITGLHNKQIGSLLGYSKTQVQRVLSSNVIPSEKFTISTETMIRTAFGANAIELMRVIICEALKDAE